MAEKHHTACAWNRPLSLPSRIVLCLAIGASLTVSNDLGTGIAVAGGLLVKLKGGLKIELSRRQAQDFRERMSL